MKKNLLAAVLCLMAFCACHRTEKRVENVAETFLNVYYTADYDAAAAYCTPALAGQLAQAARAQADLPAETAQKMKEALSQTSFTIVSVELDEATASARVRYDLTVPGLEKPVPKTLRLQLEGRTAAVDGIE